MNDVQRAVLRAVCDTVVPSLERDPDPDGFWARSASDVGTPEALEQMIEESMPPEQREGMLELLGALAQLGFLGAPGRASAAAARALHPPTRQGPGADARGGRLGVRLGRRRRSDRRRAGHQG